MAIKKRMDKIETLSVNEASEVYGVMIQSFVEDAVGKVMDCAFERYVAYWEDQANNGWAQTLERHPLTSCDTVL